MSTRMTDDDTGDTVVEGYRIRQGLAETLPEKRYPSKAAFAEAHGGDA